MAVTINASTSTGLVQSADTSGEIELQSNGTTALKVNTNEGIQILNCLGVGNATPSTSGAGITFPATQSASTDANTLDDYEEGTFTPTFVAASGSISSYGTQLGRYTKIGNTVFFEVNLSASNIGTISGQMKVGGLPFTPSSTVATNYSIFLGRKTGFNAAPLGGAIFGGDTNFELYKFGSSANNTTDSQSGDFANNCQIYTSGFYQV